MVSLLAVIIPITIALSIGGAVVAAQTGAFNFLGIGPNTVPIINGTILNNDNKTYYILILPTNITAPTPSPVPTPTPVPVPTPNKSPVVNVTSPINCPVDQNCILTAKIDDPDGNITQAIWNQESGKQVDFTSSVDYNTTPDTYTAVFKPVINETYVFSIEAQDNNGSSVLKSITVNPKVAPTPAPTPVPVPVPIPLPSQCEPDEHLVNNICIPNTPEPTPVPTPTPAPVPAPTPTDIKIILTGDVASGTAGTNVLNAIKKENPTNVVVLGDLGYQSDLKWFKSTYGTLGNKLNCVIGNHDAVEDGSSSIFKEAQQFCGDSYFFKKNHVLFFGFDTNGDLIGQSTAAGKLLTDTNFMNGITSVHIMSHKNCAVPPNSHHPVEVKAFCDAIKSKIPNNVRAYYDQAHNHIMASTADGTYKIIGSGGKSHYTCGTSSTWTFCDNAHFGFLEYIIKPDGTTTSKFIDSNGSEVTGVK